MTKARLFSLLTLALICLCGVAFAAGPGNTAYISSITDTTGSEVTSLTDGNTTTTWTQPYSSYGPDLTINLYSATVGEIWIRNGHCYSQNYYDHYDRPDVISVTVWYTVSQYTTSSVTYRYRLSDSFQPEETSSSWHNGYQRLLLPQEMINVTSIELTIESATMGYGSTGATITDIIVSGGVHATATPYTRYTATPRPYVQYITPTPTPYNPEVTPTPTREVVILTPEPTEPIIEFITPAPTPDIPTPTPTPTPEPMVTYPSEGVITTLLKTAATRSGPSVYYDEPGSFFSRGDEINVISKAWDEENELWWFQIEFNYLGDWLRAYTPENRVNLDPDLVPTELDVGDPREVLYDQRVYFGPGEHFYVYQHSLLYAGARAVIYAYEEVDGVLWAQIHYHDYAVDLDRRGWVPVECLSTYPFSW